MQHPVIEYKPGKKNLIYSALSALIVWTAITLQFCISIPAYLQAGQSVAGAVVQLLSYFTILSNILAGIVLTVMIIKPQPASGGFFKRGSVVTRITLYIIIVGLVYNLVLRSLWLPQGLFKVANELLHLVNPILFVVYWLFLVPKEQLLWQQALKWLIFPLLYLIYTFIRGAFYHYYPYPFMDVDKLGYQRVLINSFFVMIAFLIFDFILFFINNKIYSRAFKAQ